MFKLPNGKKIDEDMALMGMEDSDLMNSYFLDKETGEVERVSELFDGDAQKHLKELEGERYFKIPQIPTWEQYEWMKEFVEDIVERENPQLADKLYIALDGKGAFGRFKRILEQDTEGWFEGWYSWKDDYVYEEFRSWLATLPIKITEDFEFFDDCEVCQAMKLGASDNKIIEIMRDKNKKKKHTLH